MGGRIISTPLISTTDDKVQACWDPVESLMLVSHSMNPTGGEMSLSPCVSLKTIPTHVHKPALH